MSVKEACPFAKQQIKIGKGRILDISELEYVRLCNLDGLTCANWDNAELVKLCPTLNRQEHFLTMRERMEGVKVHA